jgi:precorrin-3B synthase
VSGHGDSIKGWCPGALRPMESGDGLILRVRPRLSRLSLVQLETLGQVAKRFGGGTLQLSNRANVLIRGVTAAGHAAALDVLAAANLIDSDPRVEAVRNIMFLPIIGASGHAAIAEGLAVKLEHVLTKTGLITPMFPLDPTPHPAASRPPSPARGEGFPPLHALPVDFEAVPCSTVPSPLAGEGQGEGVFTIAKENIGAIKQAEALYSLPAKFGIAVQAGRDIDTAALSDMTFLVQEDRIAMLLEGAPSRAAVFSGTREAVDAFLRVALVFLSLRDASPDIRRMRDAVDRFGLDAIAKEARLAFRGHTLRLSEMPAPVGDLVEAFGIAFAFGEIGYAALQEITGTMRRQGIPEAALSPRRALVFPVEEQEDKAAFQDLAERIGGITSPGDLRLRVHACLGAPACPRAAVPARRDAQTLLAALCEGELPEGTIHISGCRKRCAYPHKADITAIGADNGRYTVTGPHGQARAAVPADRLASVVAELAGAL